MIAAPPRHRRLSPGRLSRGTYGGPRAHDVRWRAGRNGKGVMGCGLGEEICEVSVASHESSLKVPPKMSELPKVAGHWLFGPGRNASECAPGSSAAAARSRGRSATTAAAAPA